jgi:hypothetical protein
LTVNSTILNVSQAFLKRTNAIFAIDHAKKNAMKRRFSGIILGMTLALTVQVAKAASNTFVIEQPDNQRSPITGMNREHWKAAARYLLEGAFSYIHTLDDPMKFPKQPGVSYPKDEGRVPTEKLEGLCRTLFLAAPLLREDSNLVLNNIRVADYYRHQIRNLIDPGNPSFIKPRAVNGGPSQNLVEFGALAVSLFAAPDVLWKPLPRPQQDSLARLMLSYGDGPTVPSNWKFFNIFVLSFFDQQGYSVNRKLLEDYLQKSLDHYRGNGWYNDNPAYDYYSMWAFQMYGTVWSQYYGNTHYPDFASKFRENFKPVKDNYPYLFDRNGRMIMWGRSISYRFGAAIPFPLMGFEMDPNTNYGWMRRIASGTMLQFLQNPDYLRDRVPTLGFYGPFEPAVQAYSCRGSVYWSAKLFLGLLVPADNPFWTAKENNGAWDSEMADGKVHNKFQQGSDILITDYAAIGASEIRAWCNVPLKNNSEKFRGSENYNRLSYNSAFPWQADGPNGETAMNYLFRNARNEWEPLRMFTFRKFADGVYYRNAVLESNPKVNLKLADLPLDNGILRIDLNTSSDTTDLHLGHYALPVKKQPITEKRLNVKGCEVRIIDNGEYQLAIVALNNWAKVDILKTKDLHPESNQSSLLELSDRYQPDGLKPKLCATLMLWKKSGAQWSKSELMPVRKIRLLPDNKSVLVELPAKVRKTVVFD